MQVQVVRRGGLAGVALRGDIDTTELPAGTRSAAEQELERLPFGRPSTAPHHPDAFQYEIVVGGADARRAVLDEGSVPGALRPLIDAALAHGRLD